MTAEEARERLARMTEAAERPELVDPDELDELLATHARNDSEDRAPTDEDWEPTYNFNAAAADGWRRKQGRAAGTSSSDSLDDPSYSPDDWLFLHCQRMAEHYAARDVWVA